MSKSSKLRKKAKRQQEKRNRRAANTAYYLELKARGQNSKSKRSLKQNQRSKGIRQRNHAFGACGNVGCKRCNPAPYNLTTPIFLNF